MRLCDFRKQCGCNRNFEVTAHAGRMQEREGVEMGCDIHIHAEVKVHGNWQHYTQLRLPRNYRLFEKMAGVRGDDANAIAAPRGMPVDVTRETRFCSDYEGANAHSHSWLSSDEILVLQDWCTENLMAYRQPSILKSFDIEWEANAYFFGNSFSGWKKYPSDNKRLRGMGVQDVRFVFWFDS